MPKIIDIDFLKDYESRHLDSEGSLTENLFVKHSNDTRSLLTNGLTTLYRACVDLAELFNMTSTEDRRHLTTAVRFIFRGIAESLM